LYGMKGYIDPSDNKVLELHRLDNISLNAPEENN